MPKVALEVTATTKHQVKLSPKVQARLLNDLKAYASAKANRDVLEQSMKNYRGDIEQIMVEAGEERIEVDGFKTTMIAPVRKKLDPKRLVALGVSMDIIAQATVEEPGTPYVKVSLPGGKDDE